ncbi:hypothetical protein N6H14_13640 [Paenibacillus sp. CC-CFT747]|nr:hypothetical protein N6H14_13640 [Paenibacillus sp. CC-CFT747]
MDELYRWSDMMYDADLVNMLCHYYGAEIKKDKPEKTSTLRLINH